MDKQFLQVVGFKLYFQVQNLCPVTCDVPLLKMIVALKIICPFYEQILRLYSFESAQVCLQSNLSTNDLTFLAKFTDTNGQEVYQAGGLFFFLIREKSSSFSFSADPPPYIDGIRINSPHYLTKIKLTSPGTHTFTLVVSQYEKQNTIHYTIRVCSVDFIMNVNN